MTRYDNISDPRELEEFLTAQCDPRAYVLALREARNIVHRNRTAEVAE